MTAVLALFFLAAATPEQRAVDYLAREVPRWQRENHCYSCHNNGDAARALYTAIRMRHRVPEAAVADTTAWVAHPAQWDSNRGNPAFSDKNLARIQFAAALAEAISAGETRDRQALIQAAESLLPGQKPDGSWQVDAGGTVGSPATYGPYLATYMVRRTLEQAGDKRFADRIARADAWFRVSHPVATLDRAAVVLAMPEESAALRSAILEAQNPDGGWGPYRHTPSEVFDTAVVLLALKKGGSVARGRAWLVKNQQPEGDWTETTRPAGSQSYAEHISTAGWATLALLATSQ